MINSSNETNIPRHVAFIMDGNRRWAKKNLLPIIEGHRMGSRVIKKIVKKSIKLNIKYLTFYSFSTENWNRNPREISDLQNLLKFYLDNELQNFINNKIKFSYIGNLDKFGKNIVKKLENFRECTKDFSNLNFILALGYGSRLEIIDAIKNISKLNNKYI